MDRILVGYAGGKHGEHALQLAADLAHAFGARVDVVSVVAEGYGEAGRPSGEHAIDHARALIAAKAILRERGVEACLLEPEGDPATTIERLVADRGYDTVIVGSSRQAANGVPWTNTVTAHVAGHANATVIVAS
jgi:nucleotide-binding universal stress UspA family protein